MTKQAFLDLRPQMLNDRCRECFDILSPFFPPVLPDQLVLVNLEAGYKQGGTAIINYNMLQAEALSVTDTLEEMNCGCLFVAPIPVSGLFTEEYLGVGSGSADFAHRILSQTRAAFIGEWVKFPPYFSVHMTGGAYKPECRRVLKELLIQNLHIRKPSTATVSDSSVASMLNKFTLGCK